MEVQSFLAIVETGLGYRRPWVFCHCCCCFVFWPIAHTLLAEDLISFHSFHAGKLTITCNYLQLKGDLTPLTSMGICIYIHTYAQLKF